MHEACNDGVACNVTNTIVENNMDMVNDIVNNDEDATTKKTMRSDAMVQQGDIATTII